MRRGEDGTQERTQPKDGGGVQYILARIRGSTKYIPTVAKYSKVHPVCTWISAIPALDAGLDAVIV